MAETQHPNTKTTTTAHQSFDELYQRYEKGIFNLVYRMVGDYEDATDLTSQTFLHALRAYDRFRGEAQAYTWLYRIAVNLCKNYFRKRDYESRLQIVSLDVSTNVDGEQIEREIEDSTQAPERMIENQDLQVLLHQAIQRLSPDLRTMVLLRDVQGLSYQEIATVVGCTLEAVKSRIYRARGQLRKDLGPLLRPETAVEANVTRDA